MRILNTLPIAVVNFDLVAFLDDGRFVIVNSFRTSGRGLLPEFQGPPVCYPAIVEHGQQVNFLGRRGYLVKDNDQDCWYVIYDNAQRDKLIPFTCFEIGHNSHNAV